MGFWKTFGYVIGGAATGVAAIVALPIAGPVGAITAAGALIAGGSGAVLGGAASAAEESANEKEQSEKVKYNEKLEQLLAKIRKHEEKFKEQKAFEEFSIAMFAVGYSVAFCDGVIHPDEESEIQEFISGQAFAKLSPTLKSEIKKLRNNPPSFNTAMEYVKKIDTESWAVFDDIIELTMHADGIVHQSELAYKEAWSKFKQTA